MAPPPTPPRYSSVKVLLICWKDSGQPEFEKQLNSLAKAFKAYNYDVCPVYKIESRNSHWQLDQRLHDFLQFDQDGTLLIIYYGGHGEQSEDKNSIWLCYDPVTVPVNNPKVNWTALQALFLDECKSSVLFVLDCCFAGSAAQLTECSSNVEAIFAVGFEGVAPLRGKDSFTRFLTDSLNYYRARSQGIYAAWLCSVVSVTLNKTEHRVETGKSHRVTPRHTAFKNRPATIFLCPLLPTSSTQEADVNYPTSPTIEKLVNVSTDITELGRPSTAILPPEDLAHPRTHSSSPVSTSKRDPSSQPGRPSYSSNLAYRPINLGRQIRIAHLLPSEDPLSPLQCRLIIEDIFSPKNSWKALSFFWSNSPHSSKIQVHDDEYSTSIPLTVSIEEALRVIRHRTKHVRLWVDFFCIDQRNIDERNYTVPMMRHIFGQAEEVIIWLGSGNEDSKIAMDLVPRLLDLTNLDNIIEHETSPAQWVALIRLMESEWFYRRWTFSETLASRNLVLYCGQHHCSWDNFCDAVLLLGARFFEIQTLCKRHVFDKDRSKKRENSIWSELGKITDLRALSAYSVAEASRELFRHSAPGTTKSTGTLKTLVTTLPGLKASWPHDAIFAMLPLACDARQSKIRPDYSLHSCEVFQKFIRYCVETTGNIDIICTPWAPKWQENDSRERNSTNPAYPSWICTAENLPFGRSKNGVYGRKLGDVLVEYRHRRCYAAAQGSIAVPIFGDIDPADPNITNWNGQMIVSGFQIGIITEDMGHRAAAGTLHKEWIKIGRWSSGQDYVRNEFWRTLVADRGPDGTLAPLWYQRACLYWLDLEDGGDVCFDDSEQNEHPTTAVQYIQRVRSVIWNRKMFVFHNKASDRLIGLAPDQAKIGDSIVILHGCSVPVILRYNDGWRLVGECFVYGAMEGEAMQWQESKEDTKEFLLL